VRRFQAATDPSRVRARPRSGLAGLANAGVRITVEISADLPDGAPDGVVRTLTEDCRTLRLTGDGFEAG
jgi:hypothetical protein